MPISSSSPPPTKSFGIGQVEVVGFDEFFALQDSLHEALATVRREQRLALAGLMVTDIYSETTLFLTEGMNELSLVMGYPQLQPHLYELKGVMSRKKQLVPHLIQGPGLPVAVEFKQLSGVS